MSASGVPLVVAALYEVERDVDAARLRGDGVGVLVDRALVERVDDGDLGAPGRGGDVGRDALERLERAAREEHGRARACERARHAAPERAAAAVDDRVLACE